MIDAPRAALLWAGGDPVDGDGVAVLLQVDWSVIDGGAVTLYRFP